MRFLFVVATALPYLVAHAIVRARRGGSLLPPDRLAFEVILLGTGGLTGILHLLLFTGLLSIPAVAAVGGAAVIVAWRTLQDKVGAAAGMESANDPGARDNARLDRWMAWLSACAAAAVCIAWIAWSASSREVAGTDAAHYHIPHAVNYALGASPWGPMPTRHGYPMGASVLFAWFILPFGDAFITDAAMLLWYLLLLAALASLFRSLTGLRGWTWVPWLTMVLFGLPLVAGSALPSADLPYAASFLAVSAQLAWMVGRGACSMHDWVVLGASLGLLVGCKTPGVYSAAALAAVAGTAHVVVRRRGPGQGRISWPAAIAVACGAGLPTGGIWLVRNIWLFGRPVEVYSDPYYLSVMADVRAVYGGDWLYAAWRAGVKIGRLLGPRFLMCGLATAWLVAESAVIALRRKADPLASTRLWFAGLMAVVAGAHVAGLVGAPWTSLEWTDGSSLRYLLPFWLLYAFLAFVGVFSLLIPWHRTIGLRAAGWLLLAVWASWWGAAATGPGGLNPGSLGQAALVMMAVLLAWTAVAARLDRGWPWLRSRAGLLVRAVAFLATAAGAASWLTAQHAILLAEATREESDILRERTAPQRATAEPHRQVFLDARAHEISLGRECRRRRFFVASRFDLPLDLQPATFTSQVFDSRNVDLVLPLIRQRPQAGVCDYAVVSEDEPMREAIRLSSAWLRPIESTGSYRVYEVVRR